MRDPLALAGVQRLVSLQGGDAMAVFQGIHLLFTGMLHDGIEPMRRNVRWVIDHRPGVVAETFDRIDAEVVAFPG